MSTIPTCAVRAVVRNSVGGAPIAGARVSAKLMGFEKYQGFVVPQLVTETTDALGVATLHLFPNQLGSVASFYEVKVTGMGATLRATAVVPNLPACELEDIVALEPYPGKPDGHEHLAIILAASAAAVTAAAAANASAQGATTAAGQAIAARDQARAVVEELQTGTLVDERIVAMIQPGDNVSIDHDPQTQTLTISAIGGGGSRPRADRVLQGVISQAAFTMGNNRFSNCSPLRDAPTITPIGAIESFMTRGYSAITGGIKPWNILGGAPVVDGFGLRGVNTTFNASTKFSILYQVDQIIDGNECNVLLEQGPQYRFLVEEDGYMKYVPDANVTLASGIEKQHYRIAFPNTAGPRVRRRFWIESGYDKQVPGTQVNTAGRFGGTYVRKADQIMRPAKPQFRSVHIGDSNIMGVNGPHGASHSAVMAAHLGLNDHWVSAIHSTGELQANIGGYVWHERRNDWREPRPHVLFFNMSWVDRQVVLNGEFTPAQAAARLMGEFNAARSEFPELVVVVLGLIWSVEEYALHPDIQLMNVAIRDAIAAKGDPLLIYMEGSRYPETPLTGRGQQGSETGQGNADIYFGQDGHYSRLGDEWTGITEAHDLLELLTTAFYNQASTEAVPRITPSSATVTGTVGVAVDRLLASVSNATPTSVTGAAPAGTSFVIVGSQLRLQGNYAAPTSGQAFPVVVKTSGGVDLPFTANVTIVAAPVASISPASGNATGTVGDAVNVLLATIAKGVPSGVTGNAPPGTAFVLSGQQLRLQGTCTEATNGNFTATVQTPNGNPTFTLSAVIVAAPVASIAPTSGTASGTVGQAVDALLCTVSGATPTGVTGTAPPGTSFVLSGQQVYLRGTYSSVASGNFTATVQTPFGNPTFSLAATVVAAPVASITPTSKAISGATGQSAAQTLGTVVNGTATGVTGTAPPGTAFAIVGQELRLTGSYTGTTSAGQLFTANIATNNGAVSFGLNATITATPVLAIAPTTRDFIGPVGSAVNMLLGTVSNGTPTGVTGTAPAGMAFGIEGQDLRLTGTPTVATAASASFIATVQTAGGNLPFDLKASIAPVIAPTSASYTGVVGTAVDVLLATVSGGVPNLVTGTAPAGLAYVISGQQIRLQGTPTATSSAAPTVVVRVTTGAANQNVNLAMIYNITAVPVVASIAPTNGTQNGTVGTAINALLGTVSGGTPTGATGSAPAGLAFTVSGQELRLTGTPTTAAASASYTATVQTANGNPTFALTSTIAAAPVVATIAPTSGTATGAVGAAMDVLLGTVSGGTPSGVTGTAPAGTGFAIVGQQLRLRGTPTAASTANFTATVATPNGNPTFVMTAAIAATGAGLVLADLKFNGTNGQKGVMQNDAPDSPEKLVFETYGPAQLSTGVGVKSGTTCLDYNHNNYDGSNCASQVEVNLNGDFELQFWFTRVSGYENTGSMFGFGDYGGASYLDVECPNNRLTFYRTPAQGDAIAEGAENSGDLLVPDTPVFVTVVRLNGMLRMTVNGQTAIGPVSSPEPVTGRVALLQVPNTGYGWPYARMDNFKLTKGGADFKTFPFTPPT